MAKRRVLAPQGRLFGTNGVRFIPGVTGDMANRVASQSLTFRVGTVGVVMAKP